MAARFWVGGNDTWDATAGTKWATTSGGAGGAAVPTASDDVTLDAGTGHGNVTISGGRVCKSLTCTNYTDTLNMGGTITVSGSVTLGSGMTITGASALIVNATGTLTSNSKTWPNDLTLSSGAGGITVSGTWTNTGTVTMNTFTSSSINTGTIACQTHFTLGATPGAVGTGTISMVGTGNATFGTFATNFNFNFNTSGTITIASTATWFARGTLSWTAGTVVLGTTKLNFNLNATCNTGTGITWGDVDIISAGSTLTLLSDLNMSGNLLLSTGTTTQTINGAFNINVGGNVSTQGTTSITLGTATIVMNGTGSLSTASSTQLRNNLTINSAGTITLSGTINYNTGTFTYTAAGSLVVTGSVLKCNVNTTIAGVGFTMAGLNISAAGVTVTVVNGQTYHISESITAVGTAASHAVLKSNSAGNQAIVIINQGATQDNGFLNVTDIDTRGGQTGWSYKGTLSNATNWQALPTQPKTIASTFC